jgi:hypothetical protein
MIYTTISLCSATKARKCENHSRGTGSRELRFGSFQFRGPPISSFALEEHEWRKKHAVLLD